MDLFDAQGRPLGLATPLDRGGEAEIYRLSGSPFRVAKIYHAQHRTAERRRKLELMIADPPDDPESARGHASIAWPTGLVVDGRGAFLGFVMPGIDTGSTRKLVDVYNVSSYPKGLTWSDLLLVARNLAVALAALHQKGYVVGDLNESNLLVASNDLITFVDCDSMQVRDAATGQVFRCPVGKAEYSPPELQGLSFGAVDRTPESDAWALSVMICQLLLLGRHPFSGGSSPRVEDNIQRWDSFLFAPGGQPPAGTPPSNVLPVRLLDLFVRCFREGHGEPRLRPTADAWADALDAAHRNLRTCQRSQVHRYSAHLVECPWCRYEQDYGFDPFTWRWQQQAAAPRTVPAPASAAPAPPPQVVWTLPPKPRRARAAVGAVALAAALGLGLYFVLDRDEMPPPPGQSLPLGRIRDPQQLVGTYTGLLDPSGAGKPVYSVLHIENVSEALSGGASFQFNLNAGTERQKGRGQARLESGLVLLSANEVLRVSLDSRNQLVLQGDSGFQLKKERP
jgi:DNA-binding helix-hairpin-helix protein with protein kinase domain